MSSASIYSFLPVTPPLQVTPLLFLPPRHSDLAVGLGLLPFHLVELGLETFVLIGKHLEPVLQGRAFLIISANQLAVDLVLESGKSNGGGEAGLSSLESWNHQTPLKDARVRKILCVPLGRTDLALQLQSFEFDLSELRLSLGFPQSDRHQFVLQLVHGILLRGLLPVAAAPTRGAAAGHVVLQKSHSA